MLLELATQLHSRLRSYYNMRENGEGAPRTYEVKGIRKDGETIWLEQHVRLTEWRGERAYYATITDISERKRQEEEAERKLATLTKAAGSEKSDMQKRLPYLDAGKAISKVLISRWRASKWL